MTRRLAPRLSAAFTACTGAASALAHDGHGLTGGHWHATDAAVYIALAAAVVAALWLGRKK